MKSKFAKQKTDIIYHFINSALAGLLVLLGSFTTGRINKESIIVAVFTSLVIMVSKFKEYWDGEETKYCKNIFLFIR